MCDLCGPRALPPIAEHIASDRLSGDQLGALEAEHREIRDALAAKGFDRRDVRDLYALAAHIEVEEMELFAGAIIGFEADEWEAMDEARRAEPPPAVEPS